MSLPYFARNKKVFERKIEEGPILLMLPDVKERVGHLLSKPLEGFPKQNLASLVNGYFYAQAQIVGFHPRKEELIKGEVVWQQIIEVIFEVVALVVPLGKADALYGLYVAIMDKVMEAQQDLFHAEQQAQALKEADADVETRFKAQMEKYSVLYEGLVKPLISLPIFCLDVIEDHKDLKKDFAAYIKDDLSYKQRKIEAATGIELQSDVTVLLTGVHKHIRNAIAHKRFEYTEEGQVTFRDENRGGDVIFEQTYVLSTFELLTKELRVNFVAQTAALILFPYEYEEKIKARGGGYEKPKQLKAAVYHACTVAEFEPVAISIEDGHLRCELQRSSALDNPSFMVSNLGGKRSYRERPPIPLREQLLDLGVKLAELMAPISTAHLRAVNYAGEALGFVKMNLDGLSSAMKNGPPFPPLETFVVDSSFDLGSDSAKKD